MPADAVTPPTFADGFGTRVRLTEADAAEPLEVLHVSRVLTSTSGFDFALRERVSRLANFRHASYGRVRRVDRIENGGTLGLVSDYAEGARLSHVLEVARACDLDLDVNAALCLLRQIVPAVAMLHQNARDASHGALAPERIVVTPNARVVLVEYMLGAAIESLGYSRERLWKDLRVAVPPGAGSPRLNHRADVMQIGVVALSLVLGRPLAEDDPRQLPGLLAAATENSVMGGREPISESLRRWLTRALQLDPARLVRVGARSAAGARRRVVGRSRIHRGARGAGVVPRALPRVGVESSGGAEAGGAGCGFRRPRWWRAFTPPPRDAAAGAADSAARASSEVGRAAADAEARRRQSQRGCARRSVVPRRCHSDRTAPGRHRAGRRIYRARARPDSGAGADATRAGRATRADARGHVAGRR